MPLQVAIGLLLRLLVGGVVECVADAALSPRPLQFRREHEQGEPIVRRAMAKGGKGGEGSQRLSPPLARSRFLRGCSLVTCDSEMEHLCIGLARRAGRGARVARMFYHYGDPAIGSVPEATIKRIAEHVIESASNEVVVFHSTPPIVPRDHVDSVMLAAPSPQIMGFSMRDLQPLVPVDPDNPDVGTVRFFHSEGGAVSELEFSGGVGPRKD